GRDRRRDPAVDRPAGRAAGQAAVVTVARRRPGRAARRSPASERWQRRGAVLALLLAAVAGAGGLAALRRHARAQAPPRAAGPGVAPALPGMPPVVDPRNLYSEAGPGRLSPAVAAALPRVYVPNLRSNSVTVIDPATRTVVDEFPVGVNPQHV